jgi:hypothetical protein
MKKLTSLHTISAVFLAVLVLAGCRPAGRTSGGLPGVTEGMIIACDDIRTCRFNMKISFQMKSERGSWDINLDTSGAIDNVSRIMQMVAEIPPELGAPDGQTVESYLDGDAMYVRLGDADLPEFWTKEEHGDGYWEAQNMFLVQLRLLRACGEITGREEIDGISCYVVSMDCSQDELTKVMVAQAGIKNLLAEGLDMSDAIESASATFWYAEDTLLPVKGELSMQLTFDLGALDPAAAESSPVTMDADSYIEFHGYNQIEELTLPDAAKDAVDSSELD